MITRLTDIFLEIVTVRVSIVTLVGFIGIVFLFIINFLYNKNRQDKKERQIDQTKNEFISLVSHQLRTPLSAMNWYIESLLTGDRGALAKEQEEYVAMLRDSNHRMITMVNAILEVSRIELDTFVVDKKPTDIVKLADQVIAELQHEIDIKKIVFKKHFEGDLTAVELDPRYVQMIIDNLLSNAIKYNKEGGMVDLAIAHQSKELHITVSDSGYGISQAEQSKVFTKMFRGHNILDKDTDGTGLGLYIIKSIVQYAGGTITFESTEGKGTTFFVVLPA